MSDLQNQLDMHRQRVDVDHFDIPVRELLRMLGDGELAIAPEYQRQFRWDETRESELVESLLLGLPIPPIFVATNADATWELVDGLQRISTILHFAGEGEDIEKHLSKKDGRLELAKLSKLTSFNGLTFLDLPSSIKITLMRRALRVTALSDKSQLDVRFDLFERLNRGGVVLTAQEVRACIYRGPFNQYLGQFAHEKRFKKILKLQRGHESDGTREEQALKFFAYLDDRSSFDGHVTDFLNEFMAANSDGSRVADWEKIGERTLEALTRVFNGQAALRPKYGNTPLNQFEAIMVAAAELLREGAKVSADPVQLMSDPELVKYSTKGTNTKSALAGRIARAKALLRA